MRRALCVLMLAVLAVGCGFGVTQEDIDRQIAEALAAVPTPTDITFPTPLPTATPQSTATPVTFPPPPTPQPTATPVTFPPPPTPQPTATPQPIVDFNAVFRNVWHSVFWIETPSGSRGTGWMVEPGLILTNQHVVAGWTVVRVRQGVGAPFTASVRAVDFPRDIALLQFDTALSEVSVFALPLELGEISTFDAATSMMALGYSGDIGVKSGGNVGIVPANSGGMVGQIRSGTSGVLNLVIDIPVDPGDSGGPVFEPSGYVVGMIRASIAGQIGTHYAVHIDEIRSALPALKRGISR